MNGVKGLALAFIVLSGGLDARAGTVEIKGAPFEMPPIAVPEFAQRDFPIADYGARPDGTKCTEAFAAAMAACEAAGGGRVVVPKGTWLTGAIRFRSNCDLHLDEGAVVEFTDEPGDYLPVVPTSWEGVECLNYSPLVYAYGVENVAITGKGELRPRMRTWRKWFGQGPAHRLATERLYYWCSTNAPLAARDLTKIPESNVRPHLLQFNRSRNILLDGFSIRESPFWTVHLYRSENAVVRNVTTDCCGRNSDGVDVEMTRNVLIENCDFSQGDDGVVLKSGRNQDAWRSGRPTENVIIRDCNIRFAHALLGIGSELSGGIRNVWMKDCRIDRCYNLLYAKTNRRRGGFVRNVLVEDVVCSGGLQGSVVGIDMDVLYQWARFPDFERRYTAIDGLTLRNTSVRSCNWAVRIAGDVHLPPRNIRVDGLKVGFCREGEREIVNCDGVEIDGLEQTDPVGAANDRKRISTVCSVEDPVGPSEVIVRQLSNARSDVSELLNLSLWCNAEGKFDFRAFPGRYRLRWLAKDGDYREKEISIPDQERVRR